MARLTSKSRADVPGREIDSKLVLDLNLYSIVDIFLAYVCVFCVNQLLKPVNSCAVLTDWY
jgi:hypothetical protein